MQWCSRQQSRHSLAPQPSSHSTFFRRPVTPHWLHVDTLRPRRAPAVLPSHWGHVDVVAPRGTPGVSVAMLGSVVWFGNGCVGWLYVGLCVVGLHSPVPLVSLDSPELGASLACAGLYGIEVCVSTYLSSVHASAGGL